MWQLITGVPFTGAGSTVGFSQDYHPAACSGAAETPLQTAPVRFLFDFKHARNSNLFSHAEDMQEVAYRTGTEEDCCPSMQRFILKDASFVFILFFLGRYLAGLDSAVGEWHVETRAI